MATEYGTEFIYGIVNGISGYRLETKDTDVFGDIAEYRNAENVDNPVETVRVTGQGQTISGTAYPIGATDAFGNKVGDLLAVNSINYLIESWKVSESEDRQKVDFTVKKWDSMTFTA